MCEICRGDTRSTPQCEFRIRFRRAAGITSLPFPWALERALYHCCSLRVTDIVSCIGLKQYERLAPLTKPRRDEREAVEKACARENT